MRFIVDAQLPQQLRDWLITQGFQAIHTTDLPEANETEDSTVARIAEIENRIVITMDSDFLKLYVLKGLPPKLLLITTGNIVNRELLIMFQQNFGTIIQLFDTYSVVETNNHFVLGHNP